MTVFWLLLAAIYYKCVRNDRKVYLKYCARCAGIQRSVKIDAVSYGDPRMRTAGKALTEIVSKYCRFCSFRYLVIVFWEPHRNNTLHNITHAIVFGRNTCYFDHQFIIERLRVYIMCCLRDCLFNSESNNKLYISSFRLTNYEVTSYQLLITNIYPFQTD